MKTQDRILSRMLGAIVKIDIKEYHQDRVHFPAGWENCRCEIVNVYLVKKICGGASVEELQYDLHHMATGQIRPDVSPEFWKVVKLPE